MLAKQNNAKKVLALSVRAYELSKFKNYLLFFSPCSYHLALERIIALVQYTHTEDHTRSSKSQVCQHFLVTGPDRIVPESLSIFFLNLPFWPFFPLLCICYKKLYLVEFCT